MFFQVIYKNGAVRLFNLQTIQRITCIENKINILTQLGKSEEMPIHYETPQQAKETFDRIIAGIEKQEKIVMH